MNKRFRLTMLALLCGGLLLVGIGAGVAFAEYAGFSYAGQRLPETARTEEQSFTVPLERRDSQVLISSYSRSLLYGLKDAHIASSEAVEPNTVRFDVTYETVGPEIRCWLDTYQEPDTPDWLHLDWSNSSDMAVLLACKDQLLADLRNHRLGDYVPARLNEVRITVNPADADRIHLN